MFTLLFLLCIVSLNPSLHHSPPLSLPSRQLPLCISFYRLLQHTAFICYMRHFATVLQSVCACVWNDCVIVLQKQRGVGKGLRIKLVSRQTCWEVVLLKVAWLQCVCVCVWGLFFNFTATINQFILLYHHAFLLPLTHSFIHGISIHLSGHRFTCMGLLLIFPIHQFAHSSIYLLIH